MSEIGTHRRDCACQRNAGSNGARYRPSSVVLTQEAARKAAGLPIEVLNYTVNIDTANGRTRAAAVTLDRVVVGGLTERSVPALVAPLGQLKNNLLGMSFSQPAAKLGGAWRQAANAGNAVGQLGHQADNEAQRYQKQKDGESNLKLAPGQPVSQLNAIARRVARNRRHEYKTNQRYKPDRKWRHF